MEGYGMGMKYSREELINNIYELCSGLGMALPQGYPEGMSNEDMERFLGVYDEKLSNALDKESECVCYFISKYEMPICNHVSCVTDDNVGFTMGIMKDGTPFEAEIFTYEKDRVKNVDIGVMLPVLHGTSTCEEDEEDDDETVTEYRYSETAINNGIMYIGMVEEYEEDNLDIIQYYVRYLVENGIIKFYTNYENGYVYYYTDQRGNMFAYVVINIMVDDNVVAYTMLDFNDFPIRKSKKNRNFKVVK